MTQDDAEILALKALSWLGRSDDLLGVFMNASGLGREEIGARAEDPEFLAAVVEFVLADDAWVTGFAEETGVPPQALTEARLALPGGDDVHWT